MTRFALAGLGAVLALAGLTLFAVSRISNTEALNTAKERARLAGYGIVEPTLDPAILTQSAKTASAVAALDTLVQTRVLSERVVRVKIWNPQGKIVYSDEPRLVGQQFPPKRDHANVLRNGRVSAEQADVNGPENRFERSSGRLLEVYLPIRTSDGQQLVYEQYETYNSVTGNSQRLLWRLALPLGAGLALLWLTQLPLARSLAKRVGRAEGERAVLLEQAMTASERERERIAANLHDGVVQDLAGLTYELWATTAATPPGELRDSLERSAGIAQTSMRRLRSSLVDLHPPTVHALGLADAIDAVAQPLRRDGIDVEVAITLPVLDAEIESILYRSAQELLRNVHEHAHATRASVTSEVKAKSIGLKITDDGAGFSESTRAERSNAGHLGIELQRALVTRAGGTLTVTSAPGAGTIATVELPR